MGSIWREVIVLKPEVKTALLFIAIALALIPLSANRFLIYLAALFMIFSLFSLGYNIMFGYAGLLSFGHSLFYAAGAYGTAMFTLNIFEDAILGLLVGASLASFLALVVGSLTLRHSKIYFAMLTLAFTMLFYALLLKWRDVTGGSDGLAGIPRKTFFGEMTGVESFYYFIFVTFFIILVLLYALEKSNIGLILKALGNNEERLEFSGYSVFKYRMIAFLISGTVSGVAGSLYALLIRVVTPDLAYWTTAAEPLIITLLGGASYFIGPLIGSVIFVIVTTATARLAEFWALILGLILVVILLGVRGGITGVLVRLWEKRYLGQRG